jgi:hypothetical protein
LWSRRGRLPPWQRAVAFQSRAHSSSRYGASSMIWLFGPRAWRVTQKNGHRSGDPAPVACRQVLHHQRHSPSKRSRRRGRLSWCRAGGGYTSKPKDETQRPQCLRYQGRKGGDVVGTRYFGRLRNNPSTPLTYSSNAQTLQMFRGQNLTELCLWITRCKWCPRSM